MQHPCPAQIPSPLPLLQVALRWDPVERVPGSLPPYDTALRVFTAHDAVLAEGPIELRWFPPLWVSGAGGEGASPTADDKSLSLAERSRRAALRSVAEAWFSYAHLAKVPTGSISGGTSSNSSTASSASGSPLPPRVEDFDRRSVVITHTSDDPTGALAAEVRAFGSVGASGQAAVLTRPLASHPFSWSTPGHGCLASAPRPASRPPRASLLLVADPRAQGAAHRQGEGREE
jgi:hypothetical protein